MKAHRQQRLMMVIFIMAGASIAVGLLMFALNKNINLFFTPTQIATQQAPVGQMIKIGGMVKVGSLKRASDSLQVEFIATDFNEEVPVVYSGLLPDLFREGQGVVALGKLSSAGRFLATEILAKHDENYMSPEVKAALDAAKKIKLDL